MGIRHPLGSGAGRAYRSRGVGGGCTLRANWALSSQPVSFLWHEGLGWDGSLCLALHQHRYRVRVHGGVRCTHHATVTPGVHYAQMRKTQDSPAPDRIGVLVLRAWLEGPADDPQLRIRLVSRDDVARDAEDTASASTAEDALAYVRDWLARFSGATPQNSAG